jgi:AcrR family transcriptional regulator
MSGNTAKLDVRVRRTRDRLGDALVELIEEKGLEAVTVQEILDRAGVGRSTFYAHYTSKDDLFLSDLEEFLEQMASWLSREGEPSRRVAPVREFFAHVADQRRLYDALLASGRIHDFLELAQGCFARGIEQRLAAGDPERRAAMAQALSGALLSLLSWWLRTGTPGSPEEMDALFHGIVPQGS